MRQVGENLCPHNTKEPDVTVVDLSENAVKDVSQHVHADTEHDSLASFVTKVWR